MRRIRVQVNAHEHRYVDLQDLSCKNLGKPTGEIRGCESCGGRKSLPVYDCSIHGTCSPQGVLRYKNDKGEHVEVKSCTICKTLTKLGKEGGGYEPDPFHFVAPVGTKDCPVPYEGGNTKKPWDYRVTAVVPHLITKDTINTVLWLLRLQTERPYIIVIDTGSDKETCEYLETLRNEDLEIHYIKAHGYIHSSAPVSTAMDLGFALCRTPYLFATHSDVFLKRRDFLEWLLPQANPVVGWEMSPRKDTDKWKGTVSHTATMFHMAPMRRAGVSWSFERWYDMNGKPTTRTTGWPDTESTMGDCMSKAGIIPKLLGPEPNDFHCTEWFDHARSLTGARAYGDPNHKRLEVPLQDAIRRVKEWGGPDTSFSPLPR